MRPLQHPHGFEAQAGCRLYSPPAPPSRACGRICGGLIAAIPRRPQSTVRLHNPQKHRRPRRSAPARRLPKPRLAQHRRCVPGPSRLMTAKPGQKRGPSSHSSLEIPRTSDGDKPDHSESIYAAMNHPTIVTRIGRLRADGVLRMRPAMPPRRCVRSQLPTTGGRDHFCRSREAQRARTLSGLRASKGFFASQALSSMQALREPKRDEGTRCLHDHQTASRS
jgi:hypothetical protein